jgi:hypothetical protein
MGYADDESDSVKTRRKGIMERNFFTYFYSSKKRARFKGRRAEKPPRGFFLTRLI